MCLNLCITGVRFYTFAYVTVFALNIKFTGKKNFFGKVEQCSRRYCCCFNDPYWQKEKQQDFYHKQIHLERMLLHSVILFLAQCSRRKKNGETEVVIF